MECVQKLDILRDGNNVHLFCYNDTKKIRVNDRDYCLYKTMQTVNNLIDEVTKLQVLHGDIERLVTTLKIEKLEKKYSDVSSLLNDKQCYACISSLDDEFINLCIWRFSQHIHTSYGINIDILKGENTYTICTPSREAEGYVTTNMCMKYLYDECVKYAKMISEEK